VALGQVNTREAVPLSFVVQEIGSGERVFGALPHLHLTGPTVTSQSRTCLTWCKWGFREVCGNSVEAWRHPRRTSRFIFVLNERRLRKAWRSLKIALCEDREPLNKRTSRAWQSGP